MKKNILIVDDELNHRLMLKLHLEDEGYQTLEAEDGLKALEIVNKTSVDLILLDLNMSKLDGFETLTKLRSSGYSIPVIIITAASSIKSAVKAIQLGATNFIPKPVEIDDLIDLIKHLFDQNMQIKNNIDYKFNGIYSKEGLGKIINSLVMVAPTDSTVLILGESGTGKELIARSIHDNSPRSHGPFIAVNVAALHENLIESELFGHEKGAFTGALNSKPGKFELAKGGTLFLDEIGELSPHIQVKLLRVLQEKTFERVGGNKTFITDVRLVAATNKDLRGMVAGGKFREDLYFRLNVFPIRIPPLRERKNELKSLIDFFVKKHSSKVQKVINNVSNEYIEKLNSYNFPGNIRELENIVERSMILAKSDALTQELLPDFIETEIVYNLGTKTNSDLDSNFAIKDNEKTLIIEALKKTNGNKSLAAKLLGISRRTLHYKVKEYNIEN